MYKIYYFIPGQSEMDDLKILDSEGGKIDYKDFKQQLGESYKFLNFNYPDFLIKNGVLSAQIVSFYCNKSDFFARTAIVNKDKFGRHLPITEVIVSDTPLRIKDLKNYSDNTISKQLNFPKTLNLSKMNTKHIAKINLKTQINIKKIVDWSKEVEMATDRIINIFESRSSISGINVCFNAEIIKKYSSYIFYSSSFHFKKKNLILSIVILLSCLIIMMIKHFDLFSIAK